MAPLLSMGIIALLAMSASAAPNCVCPSAEEATTMALEGDASTALAGVTNGFNAFATDFTKTTADMDKKSFVTSPLSVWATLAMMAVGATDETLLQFSNHLKLTSDIKQTHLGVKSLLDNLNAYGDDLRVAEKLFTPCEGSSLKPGYLSLITSIFGSQPQSLPFTDSKRASSAINNWCAEQTANRITDIVTADDLSIDTNLVLVNTVYFKGDWLNPFNIDKTEQLEFHGVAGTKNVDFMYQKLDCKWGILPELNAEFIRLPYANKEISMFVVLPDSSGSLAHLEDNLGEISSSSFKGKGVMTSVDVYLPKFRIESKFDVLEILNNMGWTELSNEMTLSVMSDSPQKIGKIIHKTFIDVSEMGTEAAAATSGVIENRFGDDEPAAVVFKADRPFYVFLATTNENPVVIFSARYAGN